MADRTDFMFRQRVTEAELDLAFELLEKADRNLAADIGLFGVVSGAVPTPHAPVPDLSIDLTAPARAYDRLGQRLAFGTGQTIGCAVDSDGLPTDVPLADQERWLGIFLRFQRQLSDPRPDGNSQQVFFRRDESFELVVRQGPIAALQTAPRVALVADELLLCDVHLVAGQTQIVAADIDTSRRQAFVFAQGDAVAILAGLWQALTPATNTVQAALDAVDAWLAGHAAGTAHRHGAQHIDYPPHGFLAATDVKSALDEVADDLASTTAGSDGASVVGATAVPGQPVALPGGKVGTQLAALLSALNTHLGAVKGAHAASAIASMPFAYLQTLNVQAQLQELVAALLAQVGAAGATRIGAPAAAGQPQALAAGPLDLQLAALLGFLNTHLKALAGAHPATAVTVADTGNQLKAGDVEAALAEIVGAFGGDHFRGVDATPGQHRTIHQPPLGVGHVVLWDANPVGQAATHLEVSADQDSIWFTLNAHWNGASWQRIAGGVFSGGFRFSRFDFEFLHDSTNAATFTAWSSSWKLPMSSAVNTGFEAHGIVGDTGRVAMANTNTSTVTQSITLAGAATFRARFPLTPSSITLATLSASPNFVGTPGVLSPNRDGFTAVSTQNVKAGAHISWTGTFTAIA